MKLEKPNSIHLAPETRHPQNTLVSLQILRAVAAWLVVFHHYMQVIHLDQAQSALGVFLIEHGYIGVEIFFVLSGFVIIHSLDHRPVGAMNFLKGRLIRILPAYWIMTLLFVAVILVIQPEAMQSWGVSTLSFVLSLMMIPHHNPGGAGIFPALTVGWSLIYEMLFYIVLAAWLMISPRFWFLGVVLTLTAFSQFLPINSVLTLHLGSLLLMLFVAGMLVSRVYQNAPTLSDRMRLPLFGLLIALGIWVFNNPLPLPLYYAVIPCTLWLIAALLLEPYLRRHKVFAPLVHLGNISYSTYLLHLGVLSVFTLLPQPDDIFQDALMLIASSAVIYVLSDLSFRHIEQRRLWSRLKMPTRQTVGS